MSHGSNLTGFPGNSSAFISCKDHKRCSQDFPSYTTCSQLETAIKPPCLNFKTFQRKGIKPVQISKFNNKTSKATKTAILWIWKRAFWGWMGRISCTSMAWMETNSKQILKIWPRQYRMYSNTGSCGCYWSLEGSTLSRISHEYLQDDEFMCLMRPLMCVLQCRTIVAKHRRDTCQEKRNKLFLSGCSEE